tara:strand:- start:1125 stop:1394 length:270 start_codon:yes stop_codon:yes gene_type:complete
MGYCITCNEWCGYSTSFCEDKSCELTRKLIGLYGIQKIGETLQKVYVREEAAIDNRTENIDMIKSIIKDTKEDEKKAYDLRKKKTITEK